MADEVVFYQVDTERTSGSAYHEFLSEVSDESPEEDLTYTHSKKKRLSGWEALGQAEAVEFGIFLVKNVAAPTFSAWLANEFLSDDEETGKKVIQTGEGAVYIEEVTVMPEDEAREKVKEEAD
jgi:hypothetical protein